MQLLRFRSYTNLHHPKRRRAGVTLSTSSPLVEQPFEKIIDFARVYIRRTLQSRTRGRGQIEVRRSSQWGITIVHRYTSSWSGEAIELPVAQLRGQGPHLELFWKRASGRWAPYAQQSAQAFVGSLAACTREIQRDRWGCFWG